MVFISQSSKITQRCPLIDGINYFCTRIDVFPDIIVFSRGNIGGLLQIPVLGLIFA